MTTSFQSAPPAFPWHSGFLDARHRGRLELQGRDAAPFLHALVSNDVASLTAGSGCYAVWLTPQGRLITDMRIYHRGDRLLVDLAPGLAGQLTTRLDQLIFAEDVRVADVSESLSAIDVYGDDAAPRVAEALGAPSDALANLAMHAHRDLGGVLVARADNTLVPGLSAYMSASRFDEVAGAFAAAGLRPVTADFIDALRIEAGRPLFGVDMNEETIPLEAGLLDRAISMTKGCYVGQEVIVRILHRGGGRVVKRLVRLRFDEGVISPPPPGTVVKIDGHDTGRITSAAMTAPAGSAAPRAIALAYVHRDAAEVGSRVSADNANAEIVGLAG